MLDKKHCVPCEGGVDPFTPEKTAEYMPLVHDWQQKDNKIIWREFTWKNFIEAISFVNKVGDIAESEGHHPDINLHDFKKVTITLSTHAINGLSENDFIVAAKINTLIA